VILLANCVGRGILIEIGRNSDSMDGKMLEKSERYEFASNIKVRESQLRVQIDKPGRNRRCSTSRRSSSRQRTPTSAPSPTSSASRWEVSDGADTPTRPKLKQLRLSGVLETLDVRHRQAINSQWAYIEFLARLLEDEVERRVMRFNYVYPRRSFPGFELRR
jgi:hypothetical protein